MMITAICFLLLSCQHPFSLIKQCDSPFCYVLVDAVERVDDKQPRYLVLVEIASVKVVNDYILAFGGAFIQPCVNFITPLVFSGQCRSNVCHKARQASVLPHVKEILVCHEILPGGRDDDVRPCLVYDFF